VLYIQILSPELEISECTMGDFDIGRCTQNCEGCSYDTPCDILQKKFAHGQHRKIGDSPSALFLNKNRLDYFT
jgi:hypothetical protein